MRDEAHGTDGMIYEGKKSNAVLTWLGKRHTNNVYGLVLILNFIYPGLGLVVIGNYVSGVILFVLSSALFIYFGKWWLIFMPLGIARLDLYSSLVFLYYLVFFGFGIYNIREFARKYDIFGGN